MVKCVLVALMDTFQNFITRSLHVSQHILCAVLATFWDKPVPSVSQTGVCFQIRIATQLLQTEAVSAATKDMHFGMENAYFYPLAINSVLFLMESPALAATQNFFSMLDFAPK